MKTIVTERSTRIFEEYFANTLVASNLFLRNYKVVDLEYELQVQFCQGCIKSPSWAYKTRKIKAVLGVLPPILTQLFPVWSAEELFEAPQQELWWGGQVHHHPRAALAAETSRGLSWDARHNLKTVHYTFSLLQLQNDLGLQDRDFQIFLFRGHHLHFPFLSKQGSVLFRKVNVSFILSFNCGELVLSASVKSTCYKNLLTTTTKKKIRISFVCTNTLLLPRLLLTANSFLEVNFKLKVENFLSIQVHSDFSAIYS